MKKYTINKFAVGQGTGLLGTTTIAVSCNITLSDEFSVITVSGYYPEEVLRNLDAVMVSRGKITLKKLGKILEGAT